jgi:hypothetical protein
MYGELSDKKVGNPSRVVKNIRRCIKSSDPQEKNYIYTDFPKSDKMCTESHQKNLDRYGDQKYLQWSLKINVI